MAPCLLARIPGAFAGTSTWTGGAGANQNWSASGNWQGGTPNSTADIFFADQGATNTLGRTNNIVDSSQTVDSLWYGNTNKYHTTLISSGVTLTVTNNISGIGNTPVFEVGNEQTANTSNPQALYTTITGSGGTLVVSNAANVIQIRQGGANSGGTLVTNLSTLDLSGLGNFTANVLGMNIGIESGAPREVAGVFYLARTNSLTLTHPDTNLTAWLTAGNPSFYIGHNTDPGETVGSAVYLGLSNAVYVNYVVVGRGTQSNAPCFLGFNSAFTNQSPTAYFRASDTTNKVGLWTIGDDSAGDSQWGSSPGTADFTGGTVDIAITNLFVGRGRDASEPNGIGIGTLTFNSGTINADTVYIGAQVNDVAGNAIDSSGQGTINVNTTNATFISRSSLELAYLNGGSSASANAATTGILNINSGTVEANTIIAGGGPSTITATNGTLIVTNTIGTTAASLGTLALTNSTLTLWVATASTNAVVTNLTTGGSQNVINIAGLPAISSAPQQFRLIDYAGSIGGAGYNFALGTLPSGFGGYLSNNTAKTAVDLVITNNPATMLAITSVNGGSSPTAGTGFSVVVQAQDGGGMARNVAANTGVTLSLNTGGGTLAGTLTGTITAGTSSVTISGATYTKAESGVVLTATRTSGDILTAGNSSSFTVNHGAFAGLQVLMPGESAAPGTASGKSGSPSVQAVGTAFNVTVNSVDANWNPISTNDTVAITSSDGSALLPANASLSGGTRTFSVTFETAGSQTVTASDVTHPAITANTGTATTVNAGNQTITFPSPGSQAFTTTPIALGATASSGLSIAYSIISGPATVSGSSMTLTGTGSVTIEANQAGNANWNAATPVDQTITVSASTMTWTNGVAGYWTTNKSWTPNGVPGGGDNIQFFDLGATTPAGTVNNTVDTNINILSLQYGNTNNFHTTQIPSGETLSITGAAGLTVGTETDNGSNQTVYATVKGAGTLVLSNATAELIVRQASTNSPVTGQVQRATLDLSGLNTFNCTVSNVLVGTLGLIERPEGTLYLAKSNSITALASGGWAGIDLGDVSSNSISSASFNYLYLGQTNAIFTDSIISGGGRSRGSIFFNQAFTNSNPVAFIRGTNGNTSRVTSWGVGDNGAVIGSTGSTSLGTNDFTGGTLDALVNTMYVGRGENATGTGASTGLVVVGQGTLDVNSLNVGWQTASGATPSTPYDGTVSVTGTGATLLVNSGMELAYSQGAACNGTLNILNGTAEVSSITAGGGASTVAMTNGTLVLTNTMGTPAAPVGTLALTNSTLQLFAVSGSTNAAVTNLVTGGSQNVIDIDSVSGLAAPPQQIRLIDYSGSIGGAGYNFLLGPMPPKLAGYLSNNVSKTAVDLVITNTNAVPTKLVITSINGGVSPTAGTGFYVVIQAEDASGTPREAVNNTAVSLSLNTGGGTLGGTLTGTMSSGSNTLTISNVTYTEAQSGVILTASRTSGDSLTAGNSSSFTVTAGAFAGLQVLMPGESAAPGSATGKTGSPTAQTVGTAVNVTVNAVDADWNEISTNDTVAITSSDGSAVLPGNAALSGGTQTFSVTFKTAGTQTVTASDVTHPSISANTGTATTVNAGNQTITFPSPGTQTYGVAPITLGATASSGLSVSYSVTSGPATVSGNTLTITGAGSVTIQATQAGNANWNAATPVSQTITVNPKSLTVSGITANNKAYNGTTAGTISTNGYSFTGVINGDTVTLVTNGYTATFASSSVGTGIAVTVSGLSLGGSGAGNYTLTQPSGLTANITALTVTISSGISANNKPYDGTTAGTISSNNVVLAGVLAGDTANVKLSTNGYSATFASSGVGTGIGVTVGGLTLTGSASGNYTLTQPAGLTANITALTVTVTSGITANNKPYDGTTSGMISSNSVVLAGVLAGDTANVKLSTNGYSATFASSGVGTGIGVTVSGLTLTGSASGNYTLTQPAGLTANITALTVTITSGISANNKPYDGTTAGTISSNSVVLAGVLAGDTANVKLSTNSYSATFASASVGTGIGVTVSGLTLTGSASGNYTLTQPSGLTANITALTVTVTSGITANNKPYDGTTAGMISSNTVVLAGVLAGDTANVKLSTNGYSATFASASVGTGIGVTVSGLTLTGSASGNYTLTQPSGLTANITALTVTISSGITANNKPYDGTTAGTISSNSVVLAGVLAGDTANVKLSTNGYSAIFASASVGTGIGVTVSGLTLTGSASGNYTLTQPSGLTANITAKSLTVSGITANNKVYDGTTAATISTNGYSFTGVAGGDTVTLVTNGYTATFVSAGVASGITVTVSGLSLGGGSAGNYTLTQPSGLTANITARPLTVTATGVNKPYDGTTTATVTLSDNRVPGDQLTNSYASAAFTDPNTGNGKTVNVSGITVTGPQAGDYTFNTTATTTANITAVTLTVTANNTNRVYGAPNPTFTAGYSGFVHSETVSVLSGSPSLTTTATSASTVAGSPYTIVAANGTLAATNYTFAFVNGQLTITTAGSANTVSASANPSPTGSNVTFTATLAGVAPSTGVPTGTVQFRSDGSLLGSPVALSGGIANLTTASLAHGTHVITAEYAGDANFLGSTNNLAPNESINTAPVATNYTLARTAAVGLKVRVATLLAGCSDPDSDPISLSSLSATSTAGGTITNLGGWVFYQPPAGFTNADSFTYVIADNGGLTATGTVSVVVNGTAAPAQNIVSITTLSQGVSVLFEGIPGRTYMVQYSTSLVTPNWQNLGTQAADATGRFSTTDPNGSTARFYRANCP
jgi:hypothetical protein